MLRLVSVVTNEKKRRLVYNMELEQISEAAQALMQAASHVETQFTQAIHLEHVRPMFRVSISVPRLSNFVQILV